MEDNYQHQFVLVPAQEDGYTFTERIDVFFPGGTSRLFSFRLISSTDATTAAPVVNNDLVIKNHYKNFGVDDPVGFYELIHNHDEIRCEEYYYINMLSNSGTMRLVVVS